MFEPLLHIIYCLFDTLHKVAHPEIFGLQSLCGGRNHFCLNPHRADVVFDVFYFIYHIILFGIDVRTVRS